MARGPLPIGATTAVVLLSQDIDGNWIPITNPMGNGGQVGVQDEGVALPLRNNLNFVGAGVIATDDVPGGRTTITIGGGAVLSDAAAIALGTAAAGTASAASREDHVHPTTGLVKTSGTQTITGRTTLFSSVVADVPLVAQGMAGQTADLQQWKDSAGNLLAVLSAGGRLGMGVAPETARVNLGNKVRLYDSIPPGAIGSTYSGVFVGPVGSREMGFVSEVDLIMSLGVNVPQVGTRDPAAVGGIFRFDTRAGELVVGGNSFIVYGYPIYAGATPRLIVSLETGDSALLPSGGRLLIGNADVVNAGNGNRTTYVANVTVLSTINPIAGGLFYSDNGWMKWRSSSGVIFDATQQAAVAAPVGGSVVDVEARSAIDVLRTRLQAMGVIAA